mmetsp:Transcript_24776/g.43297  ORF Transcript_24776/g.43297 Transcript_24776/m.43297 type:complete len:218 (-) Transcript_24776:742-1395(-)
MCSPINLEDLLRSLSMSSAACPVATSKPSTSRSPSLGSNRALSVLAIWSSPRATSTFSSCTRGEADFTVWRLMTRSSRFLPFFSCLTLTNSLYPFPALCSRSSNFSIRWLKKRGTSLQSACRAQNRNSSAMNKGSSVTAEVGMDLAMSLRILTMYFLRSFVRAALYFASPSGPANVDVWRRPSSSASFSSNSCLMWCICCFTRSKSNLRWSSDLKVV